MSFPVARRDAASDGESEPEDSDFSETESEVAGDEASDARSPGAVGEDAALAEASGHVGDSRRGSGEKGDVDDTAEPSDAEGEEESTSDGAPSDSCSDVDEAALEAGSQEDQSRRAGARNKQAARARVQPFDVPKAGQFWLHDDRFAGEEESQSARRGPVRAARNRVAILASATAKAGDAADADLDSEDRHADTQPKLWDPASEERWVHDGYEALERGESASLAATSHAFSRMSLRGGRGGRRGGGAGRGRPGGARGLAQSSDAASPQNIAPRRKQQSLPAAVQPQLEQRREEQTGGGPRPGKQVAEGSAARVLTVPRPAQVGASRDPGANGRGRARGRGRGGRVSGSVSHPRDASRHVAVDAEPGGSSSGGEMAGPSRPTSGGGSRLSVEAPGFRPSSAASEVRGGGSAAAEAAAAEMAQQAAAAQLVYGEHVWQQYAAAAGTAAGGYYVAAPTEYEYGGMDPRGGGGGPPTYYPGVVPGHYAAAYGVPPAYLPVPYSGEVGYSMPAPLPPTLPPAPIRRPIPITSPPGVAELSGSRAAESIDSNQRPAPTANEARSARRFSTAAAARE